MLEVINYKEVSIVDGLEKTKESKHFDSLTSCGIGLMYMLHCRKSVLHCLPWDKGGDIYRFCCIWLSFREWEYLVHSKSILLCGNCSMVDSSLWKTKTISHLFITIKAQFMQVNPPSSPKSRAECSDRCGLYAIQRLALLHTKCLTLVQPINNTSNLVYSERMSATWVQELCHFSQEIASIRNLL